MTALDTPAPRISTESLVAEEIQLEQKPEAPTRQVRSSAVRWLL